MQLLPEIKAITHTAPDAVALSLYVQPALHYFPNHFPDFPILPGVVQLNWAVHFAREHLAMTGKFSALENIKFQSIVLPQQALELSLKWHAPQQRLEFVFALGAQKFSSGRIIFGGAA
ncbi:hypothetical protein LG201_00755 [Methylobacillus gramineus]|uniref:ApeI family dehydratase n=1 Tax=Methylobacillus gramineus TaxID=755169 RepID=UPI001D00118E|nr:hypothetical protein [Methylobacillus gramineus]MCB5183733.1 hypothetical protein [Methylobacillus gramineus]